MKIGERKPYFIICFILMLMMKSQQINIYVVTKSVSIVSFSNLPEILY